MLMAERGYHGCATEEEGVIAFGMVMGVVACQPFQGGQLLALPISCLPHPGRALTDDLEQIIATGQEFAGLALAVIPDLPPQLEQLVGRIVGNGLGFGLGFGFGHLEPNRQPCRLVVGVDGLGLIGF